MLVGVLHGDSLREYHELSGGAPLRLIVPPAIWLSTPDERLSRYTSDQLAVSDIDTGKGQEVQVRATMFRNLYNPKTQIPGLYAACVPADGKTAAAMRYRLGVQVDNPDFVPNFLIAHDTMRSRACRTFFRSFSDALSRRTLTFLLFEADPANESHRVLFENYNAEVTTEMAAFESMGMMATAGLYDG